MTDYDDHAIHDQLLQLEKVLDWKGSSELRRLANDPEVLRTLEEMELFRAALSAESTVSAGFVDRVLEALPLEEPRRTIPWLGVLNGVAAAVTCFIALVLFVGGAAAGGSAGWVALAFSLVFGTAWGVMSNRWTPVDSMAWSGAGGAR